MARILDCWELGNGRAYIAIMGAEDKLFAKAGHEVHFAGRDMRFAEKVLGSRIKYYQAPTQVVPAGMLVPNPMTFADVLINLGFGDARNVTGRVRCWRNLIDLIKPDLMRCGNAPGALLAARGTGIRTVALGIGFQVPPSVSPLPILRTWAKGDPARIVAREQSVLSAMNQALDAVDAPRITSIGALYAEADMRMVYSYPELDEYGPRPDVHYVGNLQAARGAAPVWPSMPGKRILACLTSLKITPQILQALAASGQPVLAYLPDAPAELKQLYAQGNLHLTDQPLDLSRAVAECDVGVTHGATFIVGGLLHGGKPQLCLPTVFPERVLADKLAAQGLLRVPGVAPAEITRALDEVQRDEAMAARLRDYAARVAHLDTATIMKTTLDHINALAKAGPRR
jgi:hypothetical protein